MSRDDLINFDKEDKEDEEKNKTRIIKLKCLTDKLLSIKYKSITKITDNKINKQKKKNIILLNIMMTKK